MYFEAGSGKVNSVFMAGLMLLCCGMLLFDLAVVACAAGVASPAEALAVLLAYTLICSGLLFTLYEMHW